MRRALTMPLVASLSSKLFEISNRGAKDWDQLLGSTLLVQGRISPDVVKGYLKQVVVDFTLFGCVWSLCFLTTKIALPLLQIEESAPKRIHVFQIEPERTDNEGNYSALFEYFHSRSRYGVIAVNNKALKDVYLIPVKLGDPLPPFIRRAELEEANRDIDDRFSKCIILAVIVRMKPFSHSHSHSHSRLPSASHHQTSSSSSRSAGSPPWDESPETRSNNNSPSSSSLSLDHRKPYEPPRFPGKSPREEVPARQQPPPEPARPMPTAHALPASNPLQELLRSTVSQAAATLPPSANAPAPYSAPQPHHHLPTQPQQQQQPYLQTYQQYPQQALAPYATQYPPANPYVFPQYRGPQAYSPPQQQPQQQPQYPAQAYPFNTTAQYYQQPQQQQQQFQYASSYQTPQAAGQWRPPQDPYAAGPGAYPQQQQQQQQYPTTTTRPPVARADPRGDPRERR